VARITEVTLDEYNIETGDVTARSQILLTLTQTHFRGRVLCLSGQDLPFSPMLCLIMSMRFISRMRSSLVLTSQRIRRSIKTARSTCSRKSDTINSGEVIIGNTTQRRTLSDGRTLPSRCIRFSLMMACGCYHIGASVVR
jgi:hypothetical protein